MKQVTKELQGMPYVNVTLMDGNGNPIARNPNATGMTFGTNDGVEQALIEVYPEAIAAQARSIVSTKLRTRIYEDDGGYNVYCNYNFPGEDRPEVLDIEHRLLEIDVQQHEGVTQNPLQIHLSFIPMGTGSANTCTFSEPTVFVEHIIDVTEQETATSLPTPMGVSAEVLPATGKVIAAFSDTEALATPLGISVSHVFNPDESNALNAYGKGFRLNVDERMVLCSEFKPSTDEEKTLNSFDYIYTDGKGRSHGFEEYFFYTTESEARNYIPEAEIGKITVDSDGDMIYEKNFKLYKVMRELRSATGWEASTRLKGVKNLALLEQRTDDERQLEEQIKDYKEALKEYKILDTVTGEVRESSEPLTWTLYTKRKEKNGILERELYLPAADAYNYHSLMLQKAGISVQIQGCENQAAAYEDQYVSLEQQLQSIALQKIANSIQLDSYTEQKACNNRELGNCDTQKAFLDKQKTYNRKLVHYYNADVPTSFEAPEAVGLSAIQDFSDDFNRSQWYNALNLAMNNEQNANIDNQKSSLDEQKAYISTQNGFLDRQISLLEAGGTQSTLLSAQEAFITEQLAALPALEEQNEASKRNLLLQLAFYNTQMEEILNRRSAYFATLEELLITYEQLVANLAHLRLSLPVSYLSKDGVVKGFNEKGDLCIIFDNYENYLAFERTEKGLVERIYDKDENAITFTYEDEKLLRITDAFGNSVKYTYTSNGMLETASFSGGKEFSFSYETENLLAEIKSTAASAEDSASDFTKVQLSYTYDKLTRAELFSLVDSIPFDLADANKSNLLSSLTIDYQGEKTMLTDERGDVACYYFDEYGTPCSYVTEENGLVTRAEHYERGYPDVDVSHGVKTLPRVERIFYAKESTLYKKPLSTFVFEMGESRAVTRNDLGEVETETRTWESTANNNTYQHESVSTYTYGDEHRPIRKRTVTTKKNADGTILSTDITVCEYFYNTSGKLIRTESYTEGKKELLGVSVSETVYDENGNVKRSFSYNTLAPGDKTYTESETDAKGYKLFDLDATGKHKTSYTYFADGSLASEHYPNGGTLAYAYDKEGNTVSVTASTADGEGNTNVTHYTAGLVTRVESGNHVVEYEYDGKRRLTKVKLDGRDYEAYSYEAADGGEIVTIRYAGNSEDIVITKNKKGDITNLSLGYLANAEFTYTEDGSVRTVHDSYSCRDFIYTYDSEKRLQSEDNFWGAKKSVTYDDKGRVATQTVTRTEHPAGGGEPQNKTILYEYAYDENDDRLTSLTVDNTTVITPTYDAIGRSTGKRIEYNGTQIANEKIDYLKHGDHATILPQTIRYAKGNTWTDKLRYTYDCMGNISAIYEDERLVSRYEYDSLGRLSREDNRHFGKTKLFFYDNCGNITARHEYAFTLKNTAELIGTAPQNAVEYKYDGDRLISYDGDTRFTYNEMGFATKYRGKTLYYTYGKHLSLTDRHGTPLNLFYERSTYGGGGITQDKDGNILSDDNFRFLYDDKGIMGCVNKNDGAIYYYRRDVQGNVIAILDNAGEIMVEYKYDAWGNAIIREIGEAAINCGLAYMNPIRYRGYYYDNARGLYYLTTRYYDPETGRFTSADDTSYLAPSTVNGLNLYAYCNNNPVMNVDPDGHFLLSVFLIVTGISALIGGISGGINAAMSGQSFWKGFFAGAIGGAVGGAIGFALGSSLLATVAARWVGSFVGNIANELFQTGSWNFEKWGSFAMDAVQDAVISTLYFYPVSQLANKLAPSTVGKLLPSFSKEAAEKLVSAVVTGPLDLGVDVFQTVVYNSTLPQIVRSGMDNFWDFMRNYTIPKLLPVR